MLVHKAILAVATAALMLPATSALASPPQHGTTPAYSPIRFTVVDKGTKGKPDVLLIPGLTSGRWVWEAEAAKLAPDYRLHLLQVNGFAGQSAGANADAELLLPAIVEDLHAYITSRNTRPVIIGHSLGGLLALMLVQKYPEDADKLVIVDATPFWGLMFGPQSTVESVRPMAVRMRDGTLSQSPAQREAVGRQTAETLALNPEARKMIVADSVASDPQVAARALYEDLQIDLRPELANIKIKALVLYAYDPTLTFPGGMKPTQEMADSVIGNAYRTMPNAKLVRVENSRHFIMADQPQRLSELIKAFLGTPSRS